MAQVRALVLGAKLGSRISSRRRLGLASSGLAPSTPTISTIPISPSGGEMFRGLRRSHRENPLRRRWSLLAYRDLSTALPSTTRTATSLKMTV